MKKTTLDRHLRHNETAAEATSFGCEEFFHDDWANSIDPADVMVDEYFEACTSPENRIILQRLGNLKDKKVLDLGCGAGEASVYFAKKGAHVTAADISGGMLEVVQQVAARHNTSVITKRSVSHALDCNDESFDIVYAANLLHHVEIEPTLAEVKRVLKPGGVFVCWDPLAHNTLINIYRRIATNVRTENEHPLRMSDIKTFKHFFSKVSYKATWFFTLWIFIKFYFIERIDPNKERYWKKILIDHRRLEKTYSFLEKLDQLFLRLFPFMRRYCWNIVLVCVK